MKKTITNTIKTALLLLISMCCFNAQTPVVYYPLNGNAIDSSGKGLHGRVQNCTPIPDRFGRPNGAIHLNTDIANSNSKIILPTPDVTGLYSETFTYSIWVRVPHFGSMPLDQSFAVFKMGNTFGSTHDFGVTNTKSISSKGFNAGSSNLNSKTNYSVCYANSNIDSTKWYHLILMRDTGNVKLFVNGILKSTSTVLSSKPKYTKGDSTAGCNLDNALSLFSIIFEVDELRIYDQVLTTAQIAALYTPAPANSGIHEKEMPSTSVYPNPSNGIVTINSNQHIANINVFDITGKAVHNQEYTNKLNQTEIDLSALNNGIYLIAVQSSNGEISKSKIVLAK